MKLKFLFLLNIFFLSSLVYSMEFENTQIQETTWNNFSIILDELNYCVFTMNHSILPLHFIISKPNCIGYRKYKIDFSSTQNGITHKEILSEFKKINVNLEEINPIYKKSDKFTLEFENEKNARSFIEKFSYNKFKFVKRCALIKLQNKLYIDIIFQKKYLFDKVKKFLETTSLSEDITKIYVTE